METLEDAIKVDVRRHEKALHAHLAVRAGDETTAEIRRVLRAFALVATAGEWATDWGLTGWDTGAAYAAVQTVAERWLLNRGRLPFEQIPILKKVRDHLAKTEHRFIPLSAVRSKEVRGYGGHMEFQDDTFFYLLPAALSNMARELGYPKNGKILEALTEGNYLKSGGEKNSQQFKLPPVGSDRPRAYRIRRTILDFEGEDDTLPTHPKATEE